MPSINSLAGGKYWWSALIWPDVLGQQFGEISNLHFARSSGMKLHLLEAELVAWGLSAKMCVDHEGIEVARIRVGLIEHLIKSVPHFACRGPPTAPICSIVSTLVVLPRTSICVQSKAARNSGLPVPCSQSPDAKWPGGQAYVIKRAWRTYVRLAAALLAVVFVNNATAITVDAFIPYAFLEYTRGYFLDKGRM